MEPIEFVLDGSDGEAVGIEYNRVTLERAGKTKKNQKRAQALQLTFKRQHRWPNRNGNFCVKEFRWEETLKTK